MQYRIASATRYRARDTISTTLQKKKNRKASNVSRCQFVVNVMFVKKKNRKRRKSSAQNAKEKTVVFKRYKRTWTIVKDKSVPKRMKRLKVFAFSCIDTKVYIYIIYFCLHVCSREANTRDAARYRTAYDLFFLSVSRCFHRDLCITRRYVTYIHCTIIIHNCRERTKTHRYMLLGRYFSYTRIMCIDANCWSW